MSSPAFQLPVWRTDPFTNAVEETTATFAADGAVVCCIRGGTNPLQEMRIIPGINFGESFVMFGSKLRVDSDALRFALEEQGL